jgi:hypothetical protein
VHILVRNLGRDGRSRLIRLVLGAHALARSDTGMGGAGHGRGCEGCDLVVMRALRGTFFRVMSVKLYAEFQSKQGRSYRSNEWIFRYSMQMSGV